MFPLRDTIPSARAPLVLWLLVAANALAFAHELRLSESGLEQLMERFALVPARVTLGLEDFARGQRALEPLAANLQGLFTSMFLHGGWLHVLGNLWTLLIFGDNVEDRMGHGRFACFYVLCGLLAGGVHVAFHPGSEVPTIGASGAIAGVMGAYFVLYPRARVITLIPILFYPLFVELPAFVFLGLWFAAQLLSSSLAGASDEASGIAFLAHVGGFVAGVLLHWLFVRRRRG